METKRREFEASPPSLQPNVVLVSRWIRRLSSASGDLQWEALERATLAFGRGP